MSRAARTLPLSADEAWDLLVDARNHARWVPLTRVETDGPPRVGTRIRATSGPFARRGWPGIVDRMVITRADPPGATRVAVFVKHGPGAARRGAHRGHRRSTTRHARVLWTEDVYLAHLPRASGGRCCDRSSG